MRRMFFRAAGGVGGVNDPPGLSDDILSRRRFPRSPRQRRGRFVHGGRVLRLRRFAPG